MDDEILKVSNDFFLLSDSNVDDKDSGMYIPEVIFHSKSLIAYNPTSESLQTKGLTGWMERSCYEH